MHSSNETLRILPSHFDDGWLLTIDDEIQSHVDLQHPEELRFEYLRRIGNLLDICWPATVPLTALHLGAGALTLPRYLQTTHPGSEQMVIELNEALVDLVTTELPLPAGTRLTAITGDARHELRTLTHPPFDVIILDIFTGHQTAPHLTGVEFYTELLDHLTVDGVVIINIGDDDGHDFFRSQQHALHQAAVQAGLAGVWTLAEASTLDHQTAGNLVLAAGGGLAPPDISVTALRTRFMQAGPYPAAVIAPSEA